MKQFEITVLARQGEDPYSLADRCTIDAEDTADAARKYAGLFAQQEEPTSEDYDPGPEIDDQGGMSEYYETDPSYYE